MSTLLCTFQAQQAARSAQQCLRMLPDTVLPTMGLCCNVRRYNKAAGHHATSFV